MGSHNNQAFSNGSSDPTFSQIFKSHVILGLSLSNSFDMSVWCEPKSSIFFTEGMGFNFENQYLINGNRCLTVLPHSEVEIDGIFLKTLLEKTTVLESLTFCIKLHFRNESFRKFCERFILFNQLIYNVLNLFNVIVCNLNRTMIHQCTRDGPFICQTIWMNDSNAVSVGYFSKELSEIPLWHFQPHIYKPFVKNCSISDCFLLALIIRGSHNNHSFSN